MLLTITVITNKRAQTNLQEIQTDRVDQLSFTTTLITSSLLKDESVLKSFTFEPFSVNGSNRSWATALLYKRLALKYGCTVKCSLKGTCWHYFKTFAICHDQWKANKWKYCNVWHLMKIQNNTRYVQYFITYCISQLCLVVNCLREDFSISTIWWLCVYIIVYVRNTNLDSRMKRRDAF